MNERVAGLGVRLRRRPGRRPPRTFQSLQELHPGILGTLARERGSGAPPAARRRRSGARPALPTHGEVFLAHGAPWRSSAARHDDFLKTSIIGPSSLGRARADVRAVALGVESAPAILFGMRASRRETFASRRPASRARGGDGAGRARRRAQERRSRRPTASRRRPWSRSRCGRARGVALGRETDARRARGEASRGASGGSVAGGGRAARAGAGTESPRSREPVARFGHRGFVCPPRCVQRTELSVAESKRTVSNGGDGKLGNAA